MTHWFELRRYFVCGRSYLCQRNNPFFFSLIIRFILPLDKLGFKHLYGQNQVEPVQPNVAFDIASLVLYGTQALPIRLKILLDRLFSVLQREEVLQVLHGFGWTQEDYARGYILQEPHGTVLERWNICSPEEEPLVLQQFLRFGETRAITQQLLLAQADQAAAFASTLSNDREREKERDRERERERDKHLQLHHQLKAESDLKKAIEKSGLKQPKLEVISSLEDRSKSSHREERIRTRTVSPPRRLSSPHSQHISHHPSPSSRPSPAPPSPLQKQSPLNLLKLPPQNGPACTVSSPPGSLNSSPLSVSPLNRLQNMQPFDFRKVAGSSAFSSNEPGRRRISENSDTSPSVNVTSPTWHLPPPLPPPSTTTSSSSTVPVNLSHSALSTNSLSTANLVGSSFTNIMPSAVGGSGNKSPSIKTEKGGTSEFGSEEDDEDEENSHNALNLSRDGTHKPTKKSNHQRKGVSPMKRAWGTSSALPLNLGTQLINPATGKKRVQCNVCLKTFCDKGALKIHFSAVHLREMHKCTVEGCNMMFSSRRSRNRHSANPNPKLHSPHLRRKISPHDGRSSQSHPILIPPHGALSLPAGGLNPLSFGAFPLLTSPPELRHQTSALDLKQSLDLSLNKYEDRRGDYGGNTNQSPDHGVCGNSNNQYDDMDDEEDYEGIVVVGDDEQDQEGDDQNDKNTDEEVAPKKIKMNVMDIDDVASNIDSNEDSLSVVDNQSVKEETAVEGGGNTNEINKPRRGRKRKNQNPTRCAIPVRTSHDDGMSTDGEGSHEPDNIFCTKKESNLPKTEAEDANVKSDEKPVVETSQKNEVSENEGCKKEKENSISQDQEKEKSSTTSPTGDHGNVSNPLRHLESLSQGRFGDGNGTDGETRFPGISFTGGGQLSPAKSHSSTLSNGPDSPGDENNEGIFSLDDGFLGLDVPLDKNNPRKCTACGKLFQNHFGVKTHYQNVHLKLMHECSIKGCNAAFPSKRSRDRHSANLNLHRKLLSTTSDKITNIWDKGHFPTNAPFHSDFLSRLYSEPTSLPLNYDTFKNHTQLLTDDLLNGERMLASSHLPFPSLGFPNLNFPGHPFIPNGLDRKEQQHRSRSTSPASPPSASSPALSVEFDVPTPDKDGLLPCKYCRQPFSDGGSLKEHYEQTHASDLFKCKISGCPKVFISRTVRNAHYERHLEAGAQRRGSASSNEYGS
ncbi:hypothetical protein Phum_PHUM243450 [Pediculus humanus corporis]|uniref:C2H2-type domain-containing protein n=1 Tax=Pediculus humanus subsp. corporis TaxID=121224 RepID=E0VJD5_PEDHC|nr:uncharacterized protein Phum_PHUM243450 [Pediculus humanus corporis]EEB13491.1 hypothetical protein Phum_PHUM243450 [Pediculus humanus corporis]